MSDSSSDNEIEQVLKRPIMNVPEGTTIAKEGDKLPLTLMSAQGFAEEPEKGFYDVEDHGWWWSSLGIRDPDSGIQDPDPKKPVSLMPRRATKGDTKRRGTKRRGPCLGDKTNVTPPWRRQRQPFVQSEARVHGWGVLPGRAPTTPQQMYRGKGICANAH